MLELFFRGFLTENIPLTKGLGLALFVFMPYTMPEALKTSLRYAVFSLLMTGSGLLVRSIIGLDLYFLPFMIGIMGIISALVNVALPFTRLGGQADDIVRRGDPLVFLSFSALMEQKLPYSETLILSAGGIFGVFILLILTAAFLEYFNLHRPGFVRAAAWRMAILGVLSFLVT